MSYKEQKMLNQKKYQISIAYQMILLKNIPNSPNSINYGDRTKMKQPIQSLITN